MSLPFSVCHDIFEDDFRDVPDDEDDIITPEGRHTLVSIADDNDSFNSNWLKI